MSEKELNALLAYLRKDREKNIFYSAPIGYFWRLGRVRRNNMLNTLIKILEKKRVFTSQEAQELLSLKAN